MAEAEKEKERLKDEIIEDLRSDKLQLHQHIAHMEKLIELEAVKEEDEVEIGKKTLCTKHVFSIKGREGRGS